MYPYYFNPDLETRMETRNEPLATITLLPEPFQAEL